MTTESPNDPLLGKYRKLLGLSESADLAELKKRYARLHEKFSRQIRSQDEGKVKKGRKNRALLEQAYTTLAGAIRSDGTAKEDPPAGEPSMSLELCSMRVGFQILEGGGASPWRPERSTSICSACAPCRPTTASRPAGLGASW